MEQPWISGMHEPRECFSRLTPCTYEKQNTTTIHTGYIYTYWWPYMYRCSIVYSLPAYTEMLRSSLFDFIDDTDFFGPSGTPCITRTLQSCDEKPGFCLLCPYVFKVLHLWSFQVLVWVICFCMLCDCQVKVNIVRLMSCMYLMFQNIWLNVNKVI